MRSMTGFGQSAVEGAAGRMQATIRSVNHRFLDVVLRLPEECRRSEAAIQRLLGERLSRGRVELALEALTVGRDAAQVELRSDVAAALARAAEQLTASGVASGGIGVGDLLRLPGVIELRWSDKSWSPDDEAMLLRVVAEALEQLIAARAEEGARLAIVVGDKLDALEALIGELQILRPRVQKHLLAALEARLEKILGGAEIEPERQTQEAALLIDRSNVAEELERLVVHVGHQREILEQTGPIGKRLDFLVQEIFRELNTLSAKCRSSEMTRVCVDAKVLCEELREQLRNVE